MLQSSRAMAVWDIEVSTSSSRSSKCFLPAVMNSNMLLISHTVLQQKSHSDALDKLLAVNW